MGCFQALLRIFQPARDDERYYSLIQGPIQFFIVDSDRKEPDGYTSNSEQATWLRKSLTKSTSPFQIVLFHHSPYSSGKHGSYEYMRWQFEQWGADAVFTGHDHLYERLQIGNIPYIINGLGGASIYKFETKLPKVKSATI